MNCVRCNMPLEANARFCRNCGQPVAPPNANANSGSGAANPSPFSQPVSHSDDAPTIAPTSWQASKMTLPPTQPIQGMQSTPQQAWTPQPQSSSPYYQPDTMQAAGTMRSGSRMGNQSKAKRQPSRTRGCLISSLVTLVVIVLLVVGGWFLLARPILHNLATNQINQALSDAINNIPPAVVALPGGSQTVTENTLNNLITLQSAPSDPVQKVTIHFTPNDAEIDFQVYGLTSSITAVPEAVNGNLIATNVKVQGLASLIMSPDEMTTILNTQFANVQSHIQHSITGVKLENGAIVLTLGKGIPVPGLP